MKFKVNIRDTDKYGPTMHGVVEAPNMEQAFLKLNIPATHEVTVLKAVPQTQACFYDTAFLQFLAEESKPVEPPSKPIVLVTVEGGVVQFVSANADVEVIVRDLDDQSERAVSTQSFAVDTLKEGELEQARAEIEQTDRDYEEDMKS